MVSEKFVEGPAVQKPLPQFFEIGYGTKLWFELVNQREIERVASKKGEAKVELRWDAVVIKYFPPERMENRRDGKPHPIPEYGEGQIVTLPNLTLLNNGLAAMGGKPGTRAWFRTPDKSPKRKGAFKGTPTWQVEVGPLVQ